MTAIERAMRGWSGRLRLLWAFLAGAVMPLGFAPLHWTLIIPPALAILFWLWRGSRPGQAFRLGWSFGVGMFAVGVSWIYVSIHDMGQLNVAVAGSITFVFVAVLALYPAVLGWAWARFCPQPGLTSALLCLPAGWVLSEWLRSHVLSGFPWLLLGHSQVDGPLAALLPVFGSLAASWLLAMSAVALLGVVGVFAAANAARLGALLVLLSIVGTAALLPTREWTLPVGAPLSFSLLQEGASQQVRWQREQRLLSINRYLDLMRDEWGRDFIVWPENALPLFHHQVGALRDSLSQQAREQHSQVLIGMPYMNRADRRYFNSAVLFPEQPDGGGSDAGSGSGGGRYDKHHLVPFTEYMPLKHWFQWLLDWLHIPMSAFSAGPAQQAALDVGGVGIGVSICFESAYPADVFSALPQAGLLVNLSNDGWFGDSLGPRQHLQIARVRAAEAGRWMLRATNTGITALIDPRGQVQERAPTFQPAVLRGEVQPMAGSTPYVGWGDKPVLSLMMVLLLSGVLLANRSRHPGSLSPTDG